MVMQLDLICELIKLRFTLGTNYTEIKVLKGSLLIKKIKPNKLDLMIFSNNYLSLKKKFILNVGFNKSFVGG
jgi:tRNA splicing ligase